MGAQTQKTYIYQSTYKMLSVSKQIYTIHIDKFIFFMYTQNPFLYLILDTVYIECSVTKASTKDETASHHIPSTPLYWGHKGGVCLFLSGTILLEYYSIWLSHISRRTTMPSNIMPCM